MRTKLVLSLLFCICTLLLCIVVLLFCIFLKPSNELNLATVYEHFATPEGQTTVGLVAEVDGFKLNGKRVRLISGSIHYFRVHPGNWRDRLRKLRASGANAVETYVAWNIHEPMKDVWDFGDGNHEHSGFANLPRFLELAREEDLLVILRPGPYITAEYEMGGHPSYLIRDPNMKLRTMYQGYTDRVATYLEKLFQQVGHLQFSKGGSIIAFQIENEYAYADINQPEYLRFLREQFISNGITELLFTSDNARMGTTGSLPELLSTINFGPYQKNDAETEIETLLSFQPGKPVWAMEFWPGWFDAWFNENHSTVDAEDFAQSLETLLAPPYNGSVNFFMFHGGTNYGFTTGATEWSGQPYAPVTTSYDYDAILSEAGDYTLKYNKLLDAVQRYQEPLLKTPLVPPQSRKVAFPSLGLQTFLSFTEILEQVPSNAKFHLIERTNMEMLDMNNGSGQRQGYILYRKRANFAEGTYTFLAGMVRDFGILMVDSEKQQFPKNEDGSEQIWFRSTQEYTLDFAAGEHTIDLLVDTLGRTHGGIFPSVLHHKGLVRNLTDTTIDFYHLNGEEITDIDVVAIEFKSAWVKNLTGWRSTAGEALTGPILIQSSFTVEGDSMPDTFLDMTGWTKGIAFVNGFNLGKYWNVGPTRTLYVPGPVLQSGINTVTIFEQLKVGTAIVFSDVPLLDP